MLGRLDRWGRALENFALVSLLSTMIVVAVAQIVLREVFNTGLVWASELLKLIVLWLTMFAAIAACRDDRHIRIDAISHLLPPSAIRVTRVVVDLFAAVVCAAVSYHAFRNLQLEIEFEETVLLDFPAWIAHAIVPIGFIVMGYRFVVSAAQKALGSDESTDLGKLT
jgi:TRAP-type C4-dicarboxylate transport system permease small subunit